MKHPDGKVVVILNAPPGAGKDTLANNEYWVTDVGNLLLNEWQHDRHSVFNSEPIKEEFKQPLRSIAYDVVLTVYGNEVAKEFLYRLLDRELKEEAWEKLGGMSPRQFLIYTSENYVKVCFGGNIFGKIAARSVVEVPVYLRTGGTIHIFSDGGFAEEIDEVVKAVGAENVYIFQWSADGCSFKGDSRRYLTRGDVADGVRFVMLPHNPKQTNEEEWRAACLQRVQEYVESESKIA